MELHHLLLYFSLLHRRKSSRLDEFEIVGVERSQREKELHSRRTFSAAVTGGGACEGDRS